MWIDYTRLAEPQPDGYDTDVLLQFAKARWNYIPKRYRARNTERKLLGVPIHALDHPLSDELEYVDQHPNIAAIEKIMSLWPAASYTFAKINDYISLLNYIDKRYDGGVPGCVCGNYVPGQMDEYMHIYTTVFDDVGGAEGIVHETGHQRLHCLGVDLETHTGLLLRNDPAERYVSPIRKDTLRPMSAVLQAQYSYVNVTQLDLKVYEVDPERGRSYLMINLPRIKEGFDEIHRNIKLTTEGQQWYDGFCRWTDRVIAAAEVAIA